MNYRYKQVEPELSYNQLEVVRANYPQMEGESDINYDVRIAGILYDCDYFDVKVVRTAQTLRESYYVQTRQSKGVGRTVLNPKRKLREGATRSDYEKALEKEFPIDYAKTILLPDVYESRDYAFSSKSQYRKRIMEIKKQYSLTNCDIKPFMV
jgi:hypothetical protein